MKTVIFDIDGTLANLNHRLHHVKNGNHRWDQFFEEADHDLPTWEMIELMKILWEASYRIILVSGRPETIRGTTQTWLEKHGANLYHALYMRPENDYRKDTIVKKEILAQIRKDFDDPEILFVVDDRPSVVKMWRDEGLICLQCAEWDEKPPINTPVDKGLLTLLVGPSGAGKSTYIKSDLSIHSSSVVSSDILRQQLCNDFRDQTKNAQVFAALHAVAKTRIDNGLPTIIDATNIKRADRLAVVTLAQGSKVRYLVLDRPLEEKYRDAGWRKELPFDLIKKHHDTFQSQLKDILKGDNLPNVEVLDLRKLNK